MPCDQIRLCQVDFKVVAKHAEVLKAAMRALGWQITSSSKTGITAITKAGTRFSLDYASGKAAVPQGCEAEVDSLKREYGFKSGEYVAKRYGWAYKRTGANTFVISRRS